MKLICIVESGSGGGRAEGIRYPSAAHLRAVSNRNWKDAIGWWKVIHMLMIKVIKQYMIEVDIFGFTASIARRKLNCLLEQLNASLSSIGFMRTDAETRIQVHGEMLELLFLCVGPVSANSNS